MPRVVNIPANPIAPGETTARAMEIRMRMVDSAERLWPGSDAANTVIHHGQGIVTVESDAVALSLYTVDEIDGLGAYEIRIRERMEDRVWLIPLPTGDGSALTWAEFLALSTDGIPDPLPSTDLLLTQDERDALDAANSPDAANAIATMADVSSGSVEGTAVLSTGETGGVKYLREDGDGTSSWQVPAGSGDVAKVGTPVDNQVGVWTGDGTIEGTAGLTYDGAALSVTGNVTVSGTVDGRDIATDGAKLDGVAVGAEVNVNADWDSSSGDSEILNKPSLVTELSDLSDVNTSTPTSGNVLAADGVDWESRALTAGDIASGTLVHERGGLEADVSAYDGFIKVSGGATSAVAAGIADDSVLTVDDADAAANDYAQFTAAGLQGRSYAEARADLSLEDADINALITATKLDDLSQPDDNTDLDTSISAHGLAPKLSNNAAQYLNGVGGWTSPSVGSVEGTSVLSTGETGGTKFLREDGDGTSSWQTPAGAGDVSDGDVLSTGLTFPGDGLHILDIDDSHDLILTPGSNLTADRVLTITTGDAARSLTLTDDASIEGTNTGDQTITLTGDVTGTGTGSFATTIADEAVTLAKMADLATDRIIGRTAGTTGVPEALTDSDIRNMINVEDGADVTDDVNVGSAISGVASKTTPVDADTMPLTDSAASSALKKVTWANIKATIKAYYDSVTATLTSKSIDADNNTVTNIGYAELDTDVQGMTDSLEGMAFDKPDMFVVDATGLQFEVELTGGGGDLDFWIGNQRATLDCTTGSGVGGRARVALTAGSDANNPVTNYIYVTASGSVATLAASTSLPTGAFCWIGKCIVPDATTWATTGEYAIQRYTEAMEASSRGLHSHTREKLRALGATYISGVGQTLDITVNGGSADNVHLQTGSGEVYQLHRQSFPAFNTGPYYYGNGLDIYEQLTDLNAALELSDGTAIVNNNRFNLVIWGAINYSTGDCKLFVNLPNGVYGSDAEAKADVNNTSDYTVPDDFRSVAFMVARIALKYSTLSSGTWTELDVYSLLGSPVGARSGGSGAVASNVFDDSQFRVYDNGDSSKQIALEASAITTGTTRTMTMPDADVDLGDLVHEEIIDAKGDLLVGTAADTIARLAVGTNDYVLTADSAAGSGVKWAASASGFSDPMTTRGDIIYRDATNSTARLGTGSAGQVLSSDGTDTSWSAPDVSSYREIYVDAAAMVSRVTNGAEATTETYDTNDVYLDGYLFDSITEEGVQFKLALPDKWDRSTIKAKFFWTAPTGASASDGVTWGIAASAVSNDDAIDGAFPASVDTDDTVIAVGDMHVVTSAAVTVGGTPALGDMVIFEVTRVVGDTNDDMAEDAVLLGVQIQINESSTAVSAW